MIKNNTFKTANVNKIALAVHFFGALLIVLWLVGGIIDFLNIPTSFIIAIFTLWLVVAIILQKSFIVEYVKHIIPFTIFFVVVLLSNFFYPGVSIYVFHYQYLFVYVAIYIFYMQPKYKTCRNLFCAVLLINYVATGIYTLIQLQANPQLARILAWEDPTLILGDMDLRGLGGYGYTYSSVIFGMIALYNAIRAKKTVRLLWLIFYAFVAYFILKAQYTICLLFFLSFSIFLFIAMIKSIKTRAIVIVLCLLLVGVFLFFAQTIFLSLSTNDFFPEVTKLRFYELSLVFSGSLSQSGGAILRLQLYWQSVVAFFNNMLMYNYPTIVVGGHATWLDLLGYYGVFAIALFVFFVAFGHKLYRQTLPSKRILVALVFLYFFALGLVNLNSSTEFFTMLFVFLPFSVKSSNNNLRRTNEIISVM